MLRTCSLDFTTSTINCMVFGYAVSFLKESRNKIYSGHGQYIVFRLNDSKIYKYKVEQHWNASLLSRDRRQWGALELASSLGTSFSTFGITRRLNGSSSLMRAPLNTSCPQIKVGPTSTDKEQHQHLPSSAYAESGTVHQVMKHQTTNLHPSV